MEYSKAFLRKNGRVQDSPYTTIYHRDLWVKNLLIKDALADEPVKVKILDFQNNGYETFGLDLSIFLFFSVEINELRLNFKEFFKYYHLEFVKVLELVNCPLDDYTYDK